MPRTLNKDRLATAVRVRRGGRGLRPAAAECGVSHTTLADVENKKEVGSDAFAKVLEWLKVPAEFFMDEDEPQPAATE